MLQTTGQYVGLGVGCIVSTTSGGFLVVSTGLTVELFVVDTGYKLGIGVGAMVVTTG